MSELNSGAETAEPAGSRSRSASDKPQHDEASLSAGSDAGLGGFAIENKLPARQDSRAATWGDNPDYDEVALAAEYDGDLEALIAQDLLPARQDSRAASWGGSPEYDEAAQYDSDLAPLASEERLPVREDSRAATWDASPDRDEADLGVEHDWDLEVLAADDQAPGGGTGDQDQQRAVPGEVPSVTPEPGNAPAEASDGDAVAFLDREDGNVAAPESSPAGAPTDTGNDTPEAGSLRELKAEYEGSLKELKAELQALKDGRQPTPDAPGDAGRQADQPRLDDRRLPVGRRNTREAEHKDDRPGPWSNAKSALYGAAGSTIGLAAADQFLPWVPHSAVDIVTGAVSLAGLLVPVAREGWRKRKHDDSPNKP